MGVFSFGRKAGLRLHCLTRRPLLGRRSQPLAPDVTFPNCGCSPVDVDAGSPGGTGGRSADRSQPGRRQAFPAQQPLAGASRARVAGKPAFDPGRHAQHRPVLGIRRRHVAGAVVQCHVPA
ncbi:hypothetical protein G6F59_017432 [Rhizopus arrhizus]|nr:hypothetical protein G6F59_017432 [Rhizopus arrhizus]